MLSDLLLQAGDVRLRHDESCGHAPGGPLQGIVLRALTCGVACDDIIDVLRQGHKTSQRRKLEEFSNFQRQIVTKGHFCQGKYYEQN